MSSLQQFLSQSEATRDMAALRVAMSWQALALLALALIVVVLQRCQVLQFMKGQGQKQCELKKVGVEECLLGAFKKKKSNQDYVIRKYLWAYQEIMQSQKLSEEDRSTMNRTLANTLRNAQTPEAAAEQPRRGNKRVTFNHNIHVLPI